MITEIILVLALFLSVITIVNLIQDTINWKIGVAKGIFIESFIGLFISCIFWGVFYYLNH